MEHLDKEPRSHRVASDKVISLEDLVPILERARQSGKTIVQCHGVFDLLHPGHIRHFEKAKQLGDILVVTLTRDEYVNKGPGRPAFTLQLRAESVAALGSVDYVSFTQAPTAVEAIRLVKPAFYVKGTDYEDKSADLTRGIYAEEKAVKEVGGEIYFTHDITFSSTEILNKNFAIYPEQAHKYLKDFRKKYSPENIIDQLQALKDLKVLVIGDTIVDEYHYCQPLGKSPKETIVSTKFLEDEGFAGGVLACANHVSSFVGEVHLVTVLGAQDTRQEFIESQLSANVRSKFFVRPDASTNIKRRYVEPAFLTKMFQIAFLNDTELPPKLNAEICTYLENTLGDYDLVIVADYGHGFISESIKKVLCDKSPFLAINVQTNSANQGYNLVTKYPRADYISIDEPELRLAMQQRYRPIKELVEEFAAKFPGTVVTITRGHNGSMTITPENYPGTHFFEAASVSSRVVDRVGAGDAYFALSSLVAAKKADAEVIGFVGNAAGSMAVGVVCNRSSIQAVPVYKFIKALLS